MSYMNLDIAKPKNPIKRKDVYVFPVTSADQIIVDEDANKRLDAKLGELMPKSGGFFTGDISFNAWGGVAFNSTNGIAYRLVADEWGQLVIQKYEKGNWVADMLNFGGGAGNEIYQNGGTTASGWNFKNISVVNSDWSSIDSKTNCIRMLRK